MIKESRVGEVIVDGIWTISVWKSSLNILALEG